MTLFDADSDNDARSQVVLASGRNPAPRLTYPQLRVFEELLAVNGSRPVAPASIAADLHARIESRIGDALERWPERSLWFGKSLFSGLGRCEGQVVADAEQRSGGRQRAIPAATAVGVIVHRAIQIAHTHATAGYSPADLVRLSVAGALTEDGFTEFWQSAPSHAQSDVLTKAASGVCAWLDTMPPLSEMWAPRFEESMSAKIGRLTIAARTDLVLGRPKPDGRQTMLLLDVKTSDLRDHHEDEAMFYALVSTLRHGVPPFRSAVLSLASGDWTEPDVTAEKLFALADQVADRAVAAVEVLGGHRAPKLILNPGCSWCPARETCPEFADRDSSKAEPPASAAGDALLPIPDDLPEFTVPERSIEPAGPRAGTVTETATSVTVDGDDPWAIDDDVAA